MLPPQTSTESRGKMRRVIASGLDATALQKYKEYAREVARGNNSSATDLTALAMMTDYLVMLSEAVAYRYVCRQAGCGLIPMRETGWFIAKQLSAATQYWLCGACGGEYKHAVVEMGHRPTRGARTSSTSTSSFSALRGTGDPRPCAPRHARPMAIR